MNAHLQERCEQSYPMVSWILELPASHGPGFRVCSTAKFSILEPVPASESVVTTPVSGGVSVPPVELSERGVPEVASNSKVSYRRTPAFS